MIDHIFTTPFMEAISWTLIHSIWQISLIGVLTYLALKNISVSKPNIRYNISLIAIGLCLFSSIITFIFHFDISGKRTTIIGQNTKDSIGEVISTLTVDDGIISILQEYINNHYTLISTIWFLGFIFLLLKLMLSYLYLSRMIQLSIVIPNNQINKVLSKIKQKFSIIKPIHIQWSDKIISPVVVGWIKPIILFPISSVNQLSLKETEAILAHELAHIKRNDFIINIIQSFTESIFYYHPIIWWLSSKIREEREHCCDKLAIDCMKGNTLLYAKTLLRIEDLHQSRNTQFAMAFTGKKEHLLNRVTRILNAPKYKDNMKTNIFSIIFICIIFLGFTYAESENANTIFYPETSNETFDRFSESNDLIVNLDHKLDITSTILGLTTIINEDTIPKKRMKIVTMKNLEVIEEGDSLRKTIHYTLDGDISENTIIIHKIDGDSKSFDTIIIGDSGLSHFDFKSIDGTTMMDVGTMVFFDSDSITKIMKIKSDVLCDKLSDMKLKFKDKQKMFKIKLQDNKDLNEQLIELEINLEDMLKGHELELLELEDVLNNQEIEVIVKAEKLREHNFPHNMKNHEVHTFDFNFDNNEFFESHKNRTPTDKLLNRMYKEHLLKRGVENKVKLSGKKLKINGKTQDKSVWLKYKNLYEKLIGTSLSKSSKIEFVDYREL